MSCLAPQATYEGFRIAITSTLSASVAAFTTSNLPCHTMRLVPRSSENEAEALRFGACRAVSGAFPIRCYIYLNDKRMDFRPQGPFLNSKDAGIRLGPLRCSSFGANIGTAGYCFNHR